MDIFIRVVPKSCVVVTRLTLLLFFFLSLSGKLFSVSRDTELIGKKKGEEIKATHALGRIRNCTHFFTPLGHKDCCTPSVENKKKNTFRIRVKFWFLFSAELKGSRANFTWDKCLGTFFLRLLRGRKKGIFFRVPRPTPYESFFAFHSCLAFFPPSLNFGILFRSDWHFVTLFGAFCSTVFWLFVHSVWHYVHAAWHFVRSCLAFGSLWVVLSSLGVASSSTLFGLLFTLLSIFFTRCGIFRHSVWHFLHGCSAFCPLCLAFCPLCLALFGVGRWMDA